LGVAGLDRTTFQLLTAQVRFKLFGETLELTALVDGGSSHCFCSPKVLSVAQSKELMNPFRSTAVKFNIKSATEVKTSSCAEVVAELNLGGWFINQNFIISSDVIAYDMVLGRNFLVSNGFIISHEDDSIFSPRNNVWIKLNVPKAISKNISLQKTIEELKIASKVHQAGLTILVENAKVIDNGPTISNISTTHIIDYQPRELTYVLQAPNKRDEVIHFNKLHKYKLRESTYQNNNKNFIEKSSKPVNKPLVILH